MRVLRYCRCCAPYLALTIVLSVADANLLIPGIMTQTVDLSPKTEEWLGFLQSALNGTEVEIRIACHEDVDLEFELQFVLRSSPCAKEFIVDRRGVSHLSNILSFYFEQPNNIPFGFHYDKIFYYKSALQRFSCKGHNGVQLFAAPNPPEPMQEHNVTEIKPNPSHVPVEVSRSRKRGKRNVYPGLNGNTIDGGAKPSLTSWHPVQTLPVDAIYLLVAHILVFKTPANDNSSHKVDVEIQWRSPNGYLSAMDYPLLHFYGFMWIFYAMLAVWWLIVCLKYWRDLLRIQFCIGVVIMVGMIEKVVFYSEYSNMNLTGQSVEGLLELAELTSCLKRTMAHVLIIIVSVGFGVVKPRLGSVLNQVTAVGVIYFIFCAIEGLTRVSKQSTEALKEKQVAKLPLVLLEILIAWWIFSSLVNTMRALRMRRNEVKLALYRRFTNVLGAATLIAVVYMIWSLYTHLLQYCMSDWKELWIDTAFWHVFFCSILVAIMILWRPSRNNQRYAFTPLLDNSEDENEDEDDEIFNSSQAGVYEMIKQRSTLNTNTSCMEGEDENGDGGGGKASVAIEIANKLASDKIQDDLKWIENNIPTSLAEALMDEDDERELRELEMSKML